MSQDKIVVVDFSGTLVKPFVAEEANLKRYDILGLEKPGEQEHKEHHATKSHYKILKEHIATTYGLPEQAQIGYIQNKGDDISLSGKEITTAIMTDIFRMAMYAVAKEHQEHIFSDGIIEALDDIKKKGYKLAIVSGVRKDIITGMLAITNCAVEFDYVFAQDPILSRDSNQYLAYVAKDHGAIEFIIGDKLSDLEPAKEFAAKSIFLKGGHATGGEEEFADYSMDSCSELKDIIN